MRRNRVEELTESSQFVMVTSCEIKALCGWHRLGGKKDFYILMPIFQ